MLDWLKESLEPKVFWTAAGSAATFAAVVIAVVPVTRNARLRRQQFADAIQVDIRENGQFFLHNIWDRPIELVGISQRIIRGSELGIGAKASPQEISNALENYEDIGVGEFPDVYDKPNRCIAAGRILQYSRTKTHLPGPMEEESLWIVVTRVRYKSLVGNMEHTVEFEHRFSLILEPRGSWVELV